MVDIVEVEKQSVQDLSSPTDTSVATPSPQLDLQPTFLLSLSEMSGEGPRVRSSAGDSETIVSFHSYFRQLGAR